jgi:hypothetical protein
MTTPVGNPRSSSPVVRLEIRVGNGRPTLYEVGDGGFLIGAVPGCDLRLPGTNLAPVLCLVARHHNGASLRKLAPVQPVTYELADGPKALTELESRATVGKLALLP